MKKTRHITSQGAGELYILGIKYKVAIV